MIHITKIWFEVDRPVPHALPSADSDIPDSQSTGPAIVGTDTAAGNAVNDGMSSISVHNPNSVTQNDTLDGPTHHDTNEYVNFEEGEQMPPMLSLQTIGLRRSPGVAKLKRPWCKYNLITAYFCAIVVAATF